MTTTSDPVRELARLFAGDGARDYLGEPVSQAVHMLQAAALAEAATAPEPLIAAALLHDVGHFTGVASGRELMNGTDNHHAAAGARWLGQWFGPEVTEPVRLHVAAKRYLCAVEPGYLSALSPASLYTLGVQGGPMNDAEMAEFEAHPMACEALRVRRWDDEAKDPDLSPPAFGYYQPLLRRLLRTELPRPAAPGPAAPRAAARRQTSTTTGMIIGRRR
jgi:gamma-butyrobetaine dioxygenase